MKKLTSAHKKIKKSQYLKNKPKMKSKKETPVTDKPATVETPAPANENVKISFLGLKFESTNPTAKAIIILVLLLIFFVVMVNLLPGAAIIKSLSG